MQPVKVFVVMADSVYLCLGMTQFIDRLHLAGDPRAFSPEMTAQVGKPLMRAILEWCNAGKEQFYRTQVAGVRQVGLAIILQKLSIIAYRFFSFSAWNFQ